MGQYSTWLAASQQMYNQFPSEKTETKFQLALYLIIGPVYSIVKMILFCWDKNLLPVVLKCHLVVSMGMILDDQKKNVSKQQIQKICKLSSDINKINLESQDYFKDWLIGVYFGNNWLQVLTKTY